MDKTIHLPLDFESRTQFRLLEGKIGRAAALAVVPLLFRELGYCAQDDEIGLLRGPRVELFKTTIRGLCTLEDLTGEGAFLTAASEGAFFCSMFKLENGHLNRDYVPLQRSGGIARSVKCKTELAKAEALKQGEMLATELMTRPDGSAMSPEEKNRTLMLIKLLDHVLGRRPRLNSEFAGVIADAFTVAKKATDEDLNAVSRYLMQQRDRQGVGLKTEDVLRDYETYLGRVMAER